MASAKKNVGNLPVKGAVTNEAYSGNSTRAVLAGFSGQPLANTNNPI